MQPPSSFPGRVPVSVALALLASLRDLDTPDDPEALAESDLPLNLRRRLGLSSVVVEQIRRYEREKDDVSAVEVAGLFELIGRRPDASQIFLEAGRRIARHDLAQRRLGARLGLRLMPQGLRRKRAWNLVRKITRRLSPGSAVRVEGRSGALVVERSLPAAAAEGGVGCLVLEGTIERVFDAYRAGAVLVRHSSCEGRAQARCTWELESAAGNGAGSEVESASESPTPRAEGNGAEPVADAADGGTPRAEPIAT